jgi:hypothetical protein
MAFGLGKSEKRTEAEDTALKETDEGGEVAPSSGSDNGTGKGDSSATADTPATEDQTEEETPQRATVFRHDYLDEEAAREGAAAATPTMPLPHADVFFVSVTKKDGSETHRFADPVEAQTFVEQLLEEGVAREEVTAFSGRKLALEVTHRPIVKLLGGQQE